MKKWLTVALMLMFAGLCWAAPCPICKKESCICQPDEDAEPARVIGRVNVTAGKKGELEAIELISPDGTITMVRLDDNGKRLVAMRDKVIEAIGPVIETEEYRVIWILSAKPIGIPDQERGL